MLCVGLQSLLSSIIWNFFMISYHTTLETDIPYTGGKLVRAASVQADILRSSPMWTGIIQSHKWQQAMYQISNAMYIQT